MLSGTVHSFNRLHWMFKIGLRSVLGVIKNAHVAKGLNHLNRGHVLYLFGSYLVQKRTTYDYAIIWEPELFNKCYLTDRRGLQ
jgi:hypothetical protein